MKKNIFVGDSYLSQFAEIIYRLAISRKPFDYADVMAEFQGCGSKQELQYNVSNYDYYGELKKAFLEIKRLLKDVQPECFEELGSTRSKKFRYIGKDDDPLKDLRIEASLKEISRYLEFCKDSAGFLPEAWIEHFFRNTQELISYKKRRTSGDEIVSVSIDNKPKNIEQLPVLYEAIKKRQVLRINYRAFSGEESEIVIHPQFLKEYNGRWHLFGKADTDPFEGHDIPLDRIDGSVQFLENEKYEPAPDGFYQNKFRDVVGVSSAEGETAKDLVVRTHSAYMHGLVVTKPFHQSQVETIPYGLHDDGEYGEIRMHVILNNELIGRILQLGQDLEVVSEQRNVFRERITDMLSRYT